MNKTAQDPIAPIDFAFYSSFLVYQSPLPISFIAAMNGLGRGPLAGAFTYAQVGMGDPTALAVLSDCYPEASFIGVDPDPSVLERAAALTSKVELKNLSVRQGPLNGEGLPDCDVITLSRVYSALPQAERLALVQALTRRLKPGGLLCVQYSSLPGAASTDMLFTLLRELAGSFDGDARTKLGGAVQRAVELANGQAFVFRQFPLAMELLQRMTQTDPAVSMREVFNTPPHGLYVTEVLREIESTGLVYAGNGQLGFNLMEIGLPQPLRAGAEAMKTVPARELYLDYARNAAARADIYVKPLDGPARDAADLLADFHIMRFGTGPDTLRRQQIAQNTGVDFTAQLYTDLLAVLSSEPRRIAELLEEPALRKHARARVLKAIQLLLGTDMAALARVKTAQQSAPLPEKIRLTSKLNRVLLEDSLDNPDAAVFSNPLTGQRLLLPLAQRLSLYALLGGDLEVAYAGLEAHGLQVTGPDNKPASAAEFKASVLAELPKFSAQDGAFLRAIGVIAEADLQ
jgi:SAM-dependent methyltransferase